MKDESVNDAGSNMVKDESHECRLAKCCLDHASACVFRVNQEGRIVYANRKACESLGYLREEFLTMSVYDIDSVVNQDTWPVMWQELCDAGSSTFESYHLRKDGTHFPNEVTVTMIEFEGHRYATAITKDITERKQLFDSLQKFQFIFDKAPFGIYLIEDGGKIAYVNEHAYRYLGYTKEEISQMSVLEIDRGYSSEEIEKFWHKQIETKSLETFETIHQKKDGTRFPVEINGIIMEFNNIPYSVSFCKDISERRKEEIERRKMEAHLRETQKMESLGTLAGGIAHDFNNILGAILGYAELTRMRCEEGSNLERYVSQIFKAGNRAKELVRQILWFSRQGVSDKGPVDFSRVANEVLKLIKVSLPSNVELFINIPPDRPPVFANEIQVHQIVMNLCTNSFHAMKGSGGVLDVSITEASILEQDVKNHPGLNTGKYIKLTISDNGCGISHDVIDRIFEPYFTTKSVGEGTGFGLSTVHGIVKDHGGDIKVYSEVGVGTTFNILLPVADTESNVATDKLEMLPTGNESVLLVDDEMALIDLGRDFLESLGYQVETRESAIDAIEAFRSNSQKYDLIISDITMPRMTGDELAQQVKAIRPEIPIILCSGFSNRIHEQTMQSIGINLILMKPVSYADLAYAVRQALDIDIETFNPV